MRQKSHGEEVKKVPLQMEPVSPWSHAISKDSAGSSSNNLRIDHKYDVAPAAATEKGSSEKSNSGKMVTSPYLKISSGISRAQSSLSSCGKMRELDDDTSNYESDAENNDESSSSQGDEEDEEE